MSLLQELEASVQEVAERVGPAVVGLGRGWGVGSGVVIAPGRVLTNAHNLRHDEVTVTFADGRRASGSVAGSDPDLDVAVIEVETGDVGADRVERRRGAAERSAHAVLALGNPGGRGLRVTPGFVSSTARSFRGPRGSPHRRRDRAHGAAPARLVGRTAGRSRRPAARASTRSASTAA